MEKDKFDSMCPCTLIALSSSDEFRFSRMSIDSQQEWKRRVVNNGTRKLIPCSDCPMCNGSGVSNS
ncbi:MAG: hypothetical protein K2X69_14445 [Silvanigrellaceae bacterium]|nr:hypothetical protein [Silvanigrellaceae bacterium]